MPTKAASSRHTAVHLKRLSLSPFCCVWVWRAPLCWFCTKTHRGSTGIGAPCCGPLPVGGEWMHASVSRHQVEWFWVPFTWFLRGSPSERTALPTAGISSLTHPLWLFSLRETGGHSSQLELPALPPKSTMCTKLRAQVATPGNYPKMIFKCILWGHPDSDPLWEWLLRVGGGGSRIRVTEGELVGTVQRRLKISLITTVTFGENDLWKEIKWTG